MNLPSDHHVPARVESRKVRSSRFDNLDAIRGAACLMVCLFHFTNSDPDFPKSTYLRALFAHGNLGVQVFFVISGFIIPVSMGKSHYQWTSFWRFLMKRGVRLHPPYLLALLVAVLSAGVASLLPGGQPFGFKVSDLVTHSLLLNGLLNKPWINAVFWTLAIEFQYYILIALVFPILHRKSRVATAVTVLVLGALSLLLPSSQMIFHWMPVFLLGWAAWMWSIDRRETGWGVALLAASLTLYSMGWLTALVSVLTVLAIQKWRSGFGPLTSVGVFSYSLYLLHGVVGGRFIHRAKHLAHSDGTEALVVLAALAGSLLVAWGFSLIVERPCMKWSQKIRLERELRPEGEPQLPVLQPPAVAT